MNKKIFISLIIFSLFIITTFSYSFAATNTVSNVKNTVMNAGNAVGNAAVSTKNAIVNGTAGITNDAKMLGQGTENTARDLADDARNAVVTTTGIEDTADSDYTSTRTSTDSNFLGMSDTTWTWLILGIVALVIVALVWYYGSQYEHRNYTDGE